MGNVWGQYDIPHMKWAVWDYLYLEVKQPT